MFLYDFWGSRKEKVGFHLPVAIIASPGARMALGGRMKQLFGEFVWNCWFVLHHSLLVCIKKEKGRIIESY